MGVPIRARVRELECNQGSKSTAVETVCVSLVEISKTYFDLEMFYDGAFTKLKATALGLDRNFHETPEQGVLELGLRPHSCKLKGSAGLPF